MSITSRDQLIDYCLRKLGAPVIEINVAPEQIEDRIDEALEVFQEFHSDAVVKTYLKHQVTSTDIANKYIDIPSNDIHVVRLLPITSGLVNSGMFSFKYQFYLNEMSNLQNFAGDLIYYEQMRQHLSLIEQEFQGVPQVTFSRHQNRLYIHGDLIDGDIKAGDYIIAEVYQVIDPDTHTSVYNNIFLKEYATALIQRQWGTNMSKFGNMQLPGGVTISGTEILQEANDNLEKLRERLRLEYEEPVDFYVG